MWIYEYRTYITRSGIRFILFHEATHDSRGDPKYPKWLYLSIVMSLSPHANLFLFVDINL
jgi:hypothetical protein